MALLLSRRAHSGVDHASLDVLAVRSAAARPDEVRRVEVLRLRRCRRSYRSHRSRMTFSFRPPVPIETLVSRRASAGSSPANRWVA